MARRWTAGESAYEEVFLPMSCLPRDGCRRSSFHDIGRHRSAHSELVKFFRYIPCWRCLHFLGHADAQHHDDRVEIWHPVKRRACWLLYLDAHWKSKDVDATLLAQLDAEDVGCERNDSSWRAEGDAIPVLSPAKPATRAATSTCSPTSARAASTPASGAPSATTGASTARARAASSGASLEFSYHSISTSRLRSISPGRWRLPHARRACPATTC